MDHNLEAGPSRAIKKRCSFCDILNTKLAVPSARAILLPMYRGPKVSEEDTTNVYFQDLFLTIGVGEGIGNGASEAAKSEQL